MPPAAASINDVTIQGVTSTQAVIAYTAPDQNPCTVDVSENVSYSPPVHDADPLIFAGANLDNRPGSPFFGMSRTFVAGKRAAEVGQDGRRYSRALQALTLHYYRITCGLDQTTGSFTTSNIPLGAGYFDPVPVDPNAPGVTAWPGFYGRNRTDFVIDPQTGLKILRATMPQDAFNQQNGVSVIEAQDMTGGSWAASGCKFATTCVNGTGTLINSTGNPGYLFISNRDNTNLFQAKSYQQNFSWDWALLHLTAWCSGASCASAAYQDRTVSVCLTVNRVTCEGTAIDQVTSTSPVSYSIGGTNPILLDWTNTPAKLNMWEMRYFSGTANVNRGSRQVDWATGDVFSIWWTAGSVINLNGVNVTIASVLSSQSILLREPWLGAKASVPYTANNTGFLIQKKTASTDAISVGAATFDYGYSISPPIDSSGVQLLNWNCSPVQMDLGGGVMGRLCVTSLGLYAVESATGAHRSLGTVAIAVPGQYPVTGCPGGLSAAVFDAQDGNKFYCVARDGDGHTSMFSLKYYGDYSDIGPANYESLTYAGQTCNRSHSNQPCIDQVNLSPPPNHLEAQLQGNPDWLQTPAATINVGGRQGNKIGLWGLIGSQNSTAWEFVYDPATQRLISATPTFRYWPVRWGSVHSWQNIQDPNYLRMSLGDLVAVSNTLSGPDAPGVGPYGATIVSVMGSGTGGAMPGVGQACPLQPAGSLIAATDWPTGNRCVHVQTDGETCDPSPGVFTAGTVSSGGSLSSIVASSGMWAPRLDGKPITIGAATYTFHFLTSSTGTITPAAAAAFSGQSYSILIENSINSPKCGNPAAYYLQDAAVRDVLLITQGPPYSWQSQNSEFMRLIVKNGNDWWLERGYKNQPFNTGWPANTMAWQYYTTCAFSSQIYNEACYGYWNFRADPQGQNATGTTLFQDPKDVATHTGTVFGTGFGIDAKTDPKGADDCPGAAATDWKGATQYPCYFVRQGPIPAYMTNGSFFGTSNPTFGGMLGIGVPNAVDSHPTVDQSNPPPGALNWFLDARPMNGDSMMVGSSKSPGVNVGGMLWKFTYAQRGCSSAAMCSAQRKLLPTLASINKYPLLDVSGPAIGNTIGTTQADWFKYCVAEHNGECRSGSAAGDLYVNGPIAQPYCDYPGNAVSGGGTYDPCIGPSGAFTHSIVQVGIGAPGTTDFPGALSRVLTHGLARYRWFTPFWNVRTFDDASWLFWRADWLDGVRSEWMASKMLPYPQPDGVVRNDFVPTPVNVTPTDPNAASAQVEFGYAENGSPDQYFCTSRHEICAKGSQTGNAYAFAGDRVAPLACASQCIINVPAISQRVLYYRIKFFNGGGNVLSVTGPAALVVP